MSNNAFKPEHMSIGTPDAEVSAHIRIAKECKHGIVEIGVLKGFTSGILCRNSNVPVYGIDPLIPDSMSSSLIGSIAEIRNNTNGCSNYTFINDYSYNVIKTFNKDIDYLFIDGDHRYDAVLMDFNDWFPKVVKNGYISIHDSAKNRGGPDWWDGPSKLADELIFDNRLEYIETGFCLTVFRKK